MRHEILTYPMEPAQMKEELSFLADHLEALGLDCEVLFGSAWGNEYYETNSWNYERISPKALPDKVLQVEESGIGQLGKDDLYVRIPNLDLEFRFCNDCDIHLDYEPHAPMVEFFYQRWRSRGFSPAEWVRVPDGAPTERLRFN